MIIEILIGYHLIGFFIGSMIGLLIFLDLLPQNYEILGEDSRTLSDYISSGILALILVPVFTLFWGPVLGLSIFVSIGYHEV